MTSTRNDSQMILGPTVLAPPERDRWLRPVVLGQGRQRASTFGKLLDQPGGLPAWAARTAIQGMVGSDDLMAAAATTDKGDKKAWDGIVKKAQERAQSSEGATVGTAIHAAADLLDSGQAVGHLPDTLRRDVEMYGHSRREYVPLAGELFVYSERFDVAGSLDRLFLNDGESLIGDLKSSKDDSGARFNALSWSLQIAAYATGKPYCATEGLLEWSDLGLPEPSLTRGVVFNVIRGQAECIAYEVDLDAALVAADIAVRVRNARKYQFLR